MDPALSLLILAYVFKSSSVYSGIQGFSTFKTQTKTNWGVGWKSPLGTGYLDFRAVVHYLFVFVLICFLDATSQRI